MGDRPQRIGAPSESGSPRLRRLLARARRIFRPPPLDVLYSERYRIDLGTTPWDPLRGERVLAFLLSESLIDPVKNIRRPHRASLWDLRHVHSAAYLDSLRRREALTEIVGVEVWDDLHERALQAQRSAVGGTMMATHRALATGRTQVNLGGGFHHAGPEGGRGFCIFNDVAVAIVRARLDGFQGAVLVIDLDLHDGNGTRAIFAADPTVFTFSVHNQTWDPDPAVASMSVELAGDVEDDEYLEVVRHHVPALLDETRPELVFYLAGADPAHDDRLGNWCISDHGMVARDRFVLDQIRRHGAPPTVILLAGGYGGRSWRHSARSLGRALNFGRVIEPPTTEEITLARYRRLTRDLAQAGLGVRKETEDWGLSEEDILGAFGGGTRPARFLGRFSAHELEMILEWTGFLDRLRGLGFPHTHLEMDLDNPAGHTLRLFGGADKSELLMELRLRIDRRSVSGMQLLNIEWLLLQNPRARFGPGKSALPGQSHPGLGLLADVVALVILMCDRLQLDGMIFVPSHFHLAATGKKYLRFVRPEDEAWFRAVSRATSELDKAAATRAVAEGRVVDERTGQSMRWHPMPMVVPISDRMHDAVEGPAYDRGVAEGLANLSPALLDPVSAY